MTAFGWERSRRFRILAGFARNWWRRCGRFGLRWCGFRAAVLRIATIGEMELGRRRSGHGGRISGAAASRLRLPMTHHYDPNQFGTNEFMQFCRLIGAEPYLGGESAQSSGAGVLRWVEYCNSPAGSTTLADTRAAAGFREPFNVRYWGVGNESWGCGGNFTRAGVCGRVSAIYGMGAFVWRRAAFVCCFGTDR